MTDPITHLLGSLTNPGGLDGYITGMEAEGQRQLVQSASLPSDMQDQRPTFEALGFTFGAEADLFIEATLPSGWTKAPSDHSMWSYVLDERGLRRVAVFYKAAFYDRRAFMRLVDVGSEVASEFLYADEPTQIPWSLLTEAESTSAMERFAKMGRDIEKYPDIYGEHLGRLADAWASVPPVMREV